MWPVRATTLIVMLNPTRDGALLHLGAGSGGAVDLATCRAAGLSPERVHWLAQTGRWQSPYRGVYVTFSGPIPLVTRQHAALLYAGKSSALSHESAGAGWRLCREADSIHISVPYPRQVDERPGLMIHRSRTLTEDDVHPSLTPRRTRIERTVLDLLAGQRTADAALGLITDAVRERATTTERLREAVQGRPRTRWRSVILEALPDVSAGAHSTLELRDAKLRRRHGLPTGTRQFRRLAGGAEYLDVVIEEWRLHVELDGRLGHDRAREIWRDMRRDNHSERQQMRHLRYGWPDLLERTCEVAIEQAVILRQQGWAGNFRRCESCPPDPTTSHLDL
jgi:hypothetical protein